ncbi:MAG: aminomethyl-transferring glycine dehydrogenase subunit GcvPA [Candidatus Thermoplasmatota archaeon]|nr:aminomethyl-transferring glycine dehydrogenase subunit GcvPA [Candidatus Thermoplasmatota archaeon]
MTDEQLMKRMIPNIAVKGEMLRELGMNSIDELFADIPEQIRIAKLNMADGMSEAEVKREMQRLAGKNKILLSFLGAGLPQHYVPSVVKAITSRSEFYTAYTPYQAELSQGMLQCIFEYQSAVAAIMGMDVGNASMYDWASALGEAARMAHRSNGRLTFLIPKNLCWEKKSVLHNYTKGLGMKVVEYGYDAATGRADIADINSKLDENVCGLYIENPNFFGVIEEDAQAIGEAVHAKGAVFIAGIDPVSLGCIKAPGEYGADIAIGEGQSIGGAPSFGGPSLGLFACKTDFMRQIPGRLIGATKDINGNRAFCLTLQSREQHIRRDKATSNICSNEALVALQSLVYLSWLGGEGLNNLAIKNIEIAENGKAALEGAGCKAVFSGMNFNEIVVKYPNGVSADKVNKKLLKKGIQGGLSLSKYGMKDCALYCFTEIHSEADISKLAAAIKGAF